MMMRTTPKKDTPNTVKMTPEEVQALRARIKNKSLADEDVTTLLGLISFCLWMQEKLSHAKLSIKHLRKFFGFRREKNTKKKSEDKGENQVATNDHDMASEPEPAVEQISSSDNAAGVADTHSNSQDTVKPRSKPKWDTEENHGRYGVKDYPGCPEVFVPFEDETLNAGYCPDCAEHNTNSKIYSEEPMVLVCLKGTPMISGNTYRIQRARCHVCAKRYTARLPLTAVAGQSKSYDASCTTTIAIHHYYAGVPFKRLEMLQAAQGVLLPDSTQYDR